MQNVMQALYLTRNARGLPASARRYNFSVVSSEKNYAASALSDLPQCAVSGLLLSIS